MDAIVMGRPTKYKDEYAIQVYKFCLLGADDKKIAALFEVSESTVNTWKIEHPDFLESIKKGKEIADAEIAHSLYHKAKGFENNEVQVFQYQGEPIIVPVVKYYAPDTGAAMAWLKNRQPTKWRDTQNIELSGPNGGPIQLQSLNTLSYDDLMQLESIMSKAQLAEPDVVDITPSDETVD